MKKIILGIVLSLIPTTAMANCPSGNCAVEINCTTGVVTYTDAPVQTYVDPVLPEPVTPTHQVVIQTANQSMGFSGSLEAVTAQLAELATLPDGPVFIDPCTIKPCFKTVVNATTGSVNELILTPADIVQRRIDAENQYQRKLELALAAQLAVITPIEPVITDPALVEATSLASTASITAKAAKTKKAKKTKKKAAIK